MKMFDLFFKPCFPRAKGFTSRFKDMVFVGCDEHWRENVKISFFSLTFPSSPAFISSIDDRLQTSEYSTDNLLNGKIKTCGVHQLSTSK
jgi:hypothetical protein